jgi:hypothetical protein
MANRYWVAGGTGNWNSTTNWSASSGGASGASVPSTADAALFNASSGAGTATLDISPTIQTLTMTGFTGTLAFGTNTISLNSTGAIYTGDTTYSVTGTPQIICTNSSATTRTITAAAVTEANSISFRFTAGTGILTVTSTSVFRDLDFTDGVNPTGYAGALNNSAFTVYGNFKASTGMTRSAGTNGITFAATSGTKTITSANVNFDCPFTFNGVGGTWQLQDALTSGSNARTCTLTAGTLNLNGYTLTIGLFNSSNSNTRTLAFGTTGKIVLTGNSTTIFTTSTATGLTVTGTNPLIQLTATATTGTRGVTMGVAGETNAISVDVTAGSDTIAFGTTSGSFKNVDLTGFTGTYGSTNSINCYGNWNWGGVTVNNATTTITFSSTSGTKTITSNGVSFGGSVTFDGVGGTWQLQDALTSGAARTCALANGTLNLASYTLTIGIFSSSNSNTRTLAFGTGKLVLTGSSATVFTTLTATGLTVTGTTSVEFTYSGSVGTRSITLGNAGESNAINVKVLAGSDIISLGTTSGAFKNLDLTGFTGTANFGATPVFYGNFDIGDTTIISGTGGATFRSTLVSTQTIRFNNANNLTITFAVNIGTGVVTTTTYRLTSSMVIASTIALTVSSGTLDFNGFNITAGTMTCAAAAHTLAFGTNTISLSGTGTIFTGSTTTTVTGTPLIICTNSSSSARVITTGLVTEANSISFRIIAGTGGMTFTSAQTAVRNLDFTDGVNPTGFAGAYGNVTNTIYGDFKASTGMTRSAGTGTLTFAATSGTKTITTANVNFDCPFTFSGVGGSWQLQDDLTSGASRTCILTAGTLDLNNYTLTIGLFASNNANVRALAFGASGKIVLAGSSGTILSMSDSTNFTTTGTSRIECSYSGSVGTRTVTPPATSATETNALSIYAIAGSDIFQISGSARFVNFDLTGFSGPLTFASSARFFGNFVLPPTLVSLSVSGSALTFAKTTGTQTLTTSGFTIPVALTEDGVGGTLLLIDNLTVSGQLSVVNGVFDAGNKNVTVDSFNSSYSSTRTIALGSGTWTLAGSGTIWNTTTITGLTVTGTAFINCTSASAKTFAGGSASYPTLNNGGSGALTISGNGTYDTISNTVQPTTFTFTSGSTKTITNFNVSGTAGNLVTINSSTPGSAGTISKASGNVYRNYLNIQDSTATGGAGWYAADSVNSGGNTGWIFDTRAVVVETSTASDAVSPALTQNSSVTETTSTSDVMAAFFVAAVSIAESASVADAIATVLFAVSNIDENATAFDVDFVSASVFGANLSEASTATDAVSPSLIQNSNVTESATGTDAVSPSLIQNSDVAESATATDAVSSLAVFLAFLQESATATDVVFVGPSTFTAALFETAQAQDNYNPAGSFYGARFQDSLTILDTVVGAFLWNPIPDDQTPNWASVNNTQSVTWNNVSDNQTPNWQNVPNTQTSGWTDVNDAQTPGWTPINP